MPSTSTLTAAKVSGNTLNTDQRDPWAAFKRKSTAASMHQPSKKPCTAADRPKETPNPHICLVCGSELSRGRDFNKKRHWIQKHPDQPAGNYCSNIVPKDHELARKFLQRNKKEDDNSKSQKTVKPLGSKQCLKTSSDKVTSDPTAEHSPQHPAVQSSLSGFVTNENNSTTENRMDKVQNDIVILMLESSNIDARIADCS